MAASFSCTTAQSEAQPNAPCSQTTSGPPPAAGPARTTRRRAAADVDPLAAECRRSQRLSCARGRPSGPMESAFSPSIFSRLAASRAWPCRFALGRGQVLGVGGRRGATISTDWLGLGVHQRPLALGDERHIGHAHPAGIALGLVQRQVAGLGERLAQEHRRVERPVLGVADLEMQVRPGGDAGGADAADRRRRPSPPRPASRPRRCRPGGRRRWSGPRRGARRHSGRSRPSGPASTTTPSATAITGTPLSAEMSTPSCSRPSPSQGSWRRPKGETTAWPGTGSSKAISTSSAGWARARPARWSGRPAVAAARVPGGGVSSEAWATAKALRPAVATMRRLGDHGAVRPFRIGFRSATLVELPNAACTAVPTTGPAGRLPGVLGKIRAAGKPEAAWQAESFRTGSGGRRGRRTPRSRRRSSRRR